MEWQTLINIGAGAGLTCAGWFMRQLWEASQQLRRDLHQIEIDLPKHYIHKDDFKEAMKEIKADMKDGFEKIDNTLGLLFKKLEKKEDKE